VPLTALHEHVEGAFRRGLRDGVFTLADVRRAIAAISEGLDPARAKGAERAFRERVRRVGQGEGGETEVRETFSELAVADFLGRRKDGAVMPAGSIDAALRAMVDRTITPADVRGLGRARAFLRAVKTYFRGLFGTVAAVKKAMADGHGQELRGMIDHLLGLDGRAPRAEGRAGGLGMESGDGKTYSLQERKDKPSSWEEVKPGHAWASAKKFLPKTGETKPKPFIWLKRGSFDDFVSRAASWLKNETPATDPWGATVQFDNPDRTGAFGDPLKNRAAHLLGKDEWGTGTRDLHQGKIDWLSATRATIENAQARVRQGESTLYFRSYKEGVHMVVVEDGAVEAQHALVTQYAPELSKTQFEGAIVEKTQQDSGLAASSSPGDAEIPAQPRDQTAHPPTPGTQGNTTPGSSMGQTESGNAPPPAGSQGGKTFSLSDGSHVLMTERLNMAAAPMRPRLEAVGALADTLHVLPATAKPIRVARALRPDAPPGEYAPKEGRIFMRPDAVYPELTFGHELGHHVSHEGFGEGGDYGAEWAPELAKWRELVMQTRAVDGIRKSIAYVSPGGPEFMPETLKQLRRWLTPEELFARSYVQVLSEQPGPVAEKLREQIHTTRHEDAMHKYWDREDFAPVLQELRDVLKKKGWIR